MELIDLVPEFNLYEEFWKIYTKSDIIPPQYISSDAKVARSIVGEGTEVRGTVYNSVIGVGVIIEEGCEIRDSIIMSHTVIKKGSKINKAIIAENCTIGEQVEIGFLEEIDNLVAPHIYNSGLATIGEFSVIPDKVKIGKNIAISGITEPDDYVNGVLESGET